MKKSKVTKHKFHIRTGDNVVVIAGDEKGKKGTVKEVLRDEDRVIITGLNIVKRHVKPSNENPEGGYLEKEAPIHISNVSIADPKTGEPTRIGRKRNEKTGKLERYAKKSGEVIKNV